MPYIAITTAAMLTGEQKETIKSELGSLITIIPGKSESGLMIAFQDGNTMYLRGNHAPSCAFMEIRLYGKAEMDAKKQLVTQIFRMMEHVLGVKENELYINIAEFEEWGSAGIYKP